MMHKHLILILALCAPTWAADPLVEPEYHWLAEQPGRLALIMQDYETSSGLPYLTLIALNWLERYPLIVELEERDGVLGIAVYRPGLVNPLHVGDVNFDGVVDFRDWGTAVAYHGQECLDVPRMTVFRVYIWRAV